MSDLDMSWAGDLSVTPTGDLTLASEPDLGTQRVLRRLLTNPGDYIWNPGYGAGLAQFVGHTVDPVGIETLVRQQMKLETAVAPIPEPAVAATMGEGGVIYLQIRYVDSVTATPSTLLTKVVG